MEDCALIMFDEFSKVLIPINQYMFLGSQFKSEKKLNKMYVGNLILFPDGTLKRIKEIRIKGYYGSTFLSKLFGILNSTHNTSVSFEEAHTHIDTLVEKAKMYLANDLQSDEPYMLAQDISQINIKNISSAKELYSTLVLPPAEDCLDVM